MLWKTGLTAAAAAFLMCADASAQSPLMFVKIGPTYSWRSTNQIDRETDGVTSIGAGGGFRIGNGALTFQPEVYIVNKTTKVDENNGELRLKLEYLEIPLLAMLTIGDYKLRPFLGAGPVISLETRCRSEFREAQNKDEIGCDLANNVVSDRKKFDYGAAAVGGLEYAISRTRKLSLEARYTHGFRNISDAEDNQALELKNRAFSVYVGYSFPLRTDM